MKKVLFTLLTCLFMLIPISINAAVTCTYNPTSTVGDKYGEITITKKDNGGFLVNGEALTSSSTVNLKRQISGTDLYFPGGPVEIMYNHSIDKSGIKKEMYNYCKQYKVGSCPKSNKNAYGTSQFIFDCQFEVDVNLFHCNVDDDFIAGGNYNVLSKAFTGNDCPALSFAAEYDKKDAKKIYLLLLGDKDFNDGSVTTAVKEEAVKVSDKDLIDIKYIYYSDNDNKENYNFFDSIVYNKATGKLNFTFDNTYSDQTFELNPSNRDDSYTLANLSKTIKFNNLDYSYIQFKIYKEFKSKLDNWNQDDYIAIVFSTGELGTLTHYVVYSGDIKEFAKNTWGYTDDQAQTLLTKISGKAGDVLNLGGNGELKKFDVETVPFCAPTSGALKVFKIVGYAIVVLKILVPIALIIFASIDFFKAMMSSSEDAIKKATTTVMQRAVIGILIFFIPTLIYYLVGLLGNSIKRDDSYFENCNTCLLNPDDCPARDPFTVEVTK